MARRTAGGLENPLGARALYIFRDGQDTGYASQRSMIFQQLSTAGLPYPFDTWDEYERCIEDMITTGILEEISECRWDVRPVPRLGTNEVRFCEEDVLFLNQAIDDLDKGPPDLALYQSPLGPLRGKKCDLLS